jgi:hypothetical protein
LRLLFELDRCAVLQKGERVFFADNSKGGQARADVFRMTVQGMGFVPVFYVGTGSAVRQSNLDRELRSDFYSARAIVLYFGYPVGTGRLRLDHAAELLVHKEPIIARPGSGAELADCNSDPRGQVEHVARLNGPAARGQLVVQSRTGAVLRMECRYGHSHTLAGIQLIKQWDRRAVAPVPARGHLRLAESVQISVRDVIGDSRRQETEEAAIGGRRSG